MNFDMVYEKLDKDFTLANQSSKHNIKLESVMDYYIYNNIEEFLIDHSYLLEDSESVNTILDDPIKFDDFLSFVQSEKNKIRYADQDEPFVLMRAKENEDANYYFVLLKNFDSLFNSYLNAVVSEYDTDQEYYILEGNV